MSTDGHTSEEVKEKTLWWGYLPGGSIIHYSEKSHKENPKFPSKLLECSKILLHTLYTAIAGSIVLTGIAVYTLNVKRTKEFSISKQKNFYYEQKRNNKVQLQHKETINFSYDSILNKNLDNPTFIHLLNEYTPFEQKEKIVKQNKLESKSMQ